MAKNLLIKVAYDGSMYSGMAKQPNLTTIESVISEILEDIGYRGKIWYLSRTDRGVHAIYQIISLLNANKEIVELISKKLPRDIFAYGISQTNRKRTRGLFGNKTYLYVAPNHGEDEEKLFKICSMISNRILEYRVLVKSPKKFTGKTQMKLQVNCKLENRYIYFYVKAKYFLWQQVRRLITFIKSYSLGKISDAEVKKVFRGDVLKKGIAPAPPEGLILWKVENSLEWQHLIPERVIRRVILEKAKIYSRLLFNKWIF